MATAARAGKLRVNASNSIRTNIRINRTGDIGTSNFERYGKKPRQAPRPAFFCSGERDSFKEPERNPCKSTVTN